MQFHMLYADELTKINSKLSFSVDPILTRALNEHLKICAGGIYNNSTKGLIAL